MRSTLAAIALLSLLSLAPAWSHAQSGRRPQPTPTPERPLRVPPSANDQPGQPSTPDAPSTTTTRPADGARPAVSPQSPQDADVPAEIDEEEVYRVNSNLVPVSANVSDAAGRAVSNLKAEDFELRVDGQPKPISDLSFAETPVRLALLFDNSSSVRQTRELEKQAAVRFLRTVLRPVDQAALFSISTYPSLDHPLTADVAKLVRTIENYGEVEGSTALFDTVVAAAEYLRPVPGRKVIVIVSDGVETTSRIADFGEVLRRTLAADCQVFVIQTGLSQNANLRDLLAERRMQDLTASTGGAVYMPKASADLDAAFAHISADLSQQYVLSYYPTDDSSDGRFRSISLRVKTRPNMRVRARRGFYPRRRTEASALPPGFVLDVAATAAPEPSPPEPRADAPAVERRETPAAPRQETAATAASRGTLHGSKNLSPDDAAADNRESAAAKPSVRRGDYNPTDARDEMKAAAAPPDAKSENVPRARLAPAAVAVTGSSSPAAESAGQPGARDDAATGAPPGPAIRAEPKSPPPAARRTTSAPPRSSPNPASPPPPPRQTERQPNAQPAPVRDRNPGGGVLNGRHEFAAPPAPGDGAQGARRRQDLGRGDD